MKAKLLFIGMLMFFGCNVQASKLGELPAELSAGSGSLADLPGLPPLNLDLHNLDCSCVAKPPTGKESILEDCYLRNISREHLEKNYGCCAKNLHHLKADAPEDVKKKAAECRKKISEGMHYNSMTGTYQIIQ